MFNVNNKGTRTTSFYVVWASFFLTLKILLTLSTLFYCFYWRLGTCVSLQELLIILNNNSGISYIYQILDFTILN